MDVCTPSGLDPANSKSGNGEQLAAYVVNLLLQDMPSCHGLSVNPDPLAVTPAMQNFEALSVACIDGI
jgi:hypothetical protein